MAWNNSQFPPNFPFPFRFSDQGPPPGPHNYTFGSRPGEAGHGIDHMMPEHGFEFSPEGFNAWSGPHGFGGSWGRRGRSWGFGLGPRGGRRGGHGHSHGRHSRNGDEISEIEEDLYDVTAAAAAAEAEMEAERDAEKAERDAEKNDGEGSPATMNDAGANENHPDPPEEVPSDPNRHHGCRGRGRRLGCRRGGWGGRGGRGPWHQGHPPFPFGNPRAGWSPFGPSGFNPANVPDFRAIAEDYQARAREIIERAMGSNPNRYGDREAADDQDNGFTPPIDIFDTSNNWTIHVSLPGAKKEDIGVNWDADRSTLTISGVVHRPGDEEFLSSIISSERRIGLFERTIQLPPPTDNGDNANKDEADGDNITARMEDGILVVVVAKVEKEWTEIKKVDIL